MESNIRCGEPSQALVDYLLTRRSAKIDALAAPGPDADQMQTILKAATRVPDHGRMVPWYFIVFEGSARLQMGEALAAIYARNNPLATQDQIKREQERFMRAPVVVALVSRMRTGKKPLWEQILSAGAAGITLSLAAHGLGFGVQWLTEWYAYDQDVKAAMGLDRRDHIAGFFYIGTVKEQPEERERPDLDKIVTYWQPGCGLNKGDAAYDQDKIGFPEAGFDVANLLKSNFDP